MDGVLEASAHKQSACGQMTIITAATCVARNLDMDVHQL